MPRQTAAQKKAAAAQKESGSTGPSDQAKNQIKQKNINPKPDNIRSGITDRSPSEDTGGRVPNQDGHGKDKHWDDSSKPEWDADQPSLSDLLKGGLTSIGLEPVDNPEQEEEEEEEEET